MRAPHIIYIVLLTFSLTVDCIKHGQPKTGEYNAVISLFGAALSIALLWWGGFWS